MPTSGGQVDVRVESAAHLHALEALVSSRVGLGLGQRGLWVGRLGSSLLRSTHFRGS